MISNSIPILIFCICVLALLWSSAYVPLRGDGPKAYFTKIVIVAICSCLFYAVSTLYDNNKDLVSLNRVLNGLYFSVSAVLPMMWLIYIAKATKAYRPEKVALRNVLRVPMGILVVLSIASIWTGWVFSVDDSGVYGRGPLYLPYTAVVTLYVVVPMLFTLHRIFDKHYYADRTMYLSLASYGFFALWGVALEIVYEGLPASAMGIVFTLLMNHLAYQRSQISTDSLTGLNNRGKLNSYMSIALENIPEDKKLFLVVLDMNNLKQINNQYGYKNGDKALVLFSVVLKRVCGPKGYFISRFGGDEFAVIAKCNDEQDCKMVVDEIKTALANASRKFACALSTSAGYAAAVEDDNIPDLFSRADRMLYAEKAGKA